MCVTVGLCLPAREAGCLGQRLDSAWLSALRASDSEASSMTQLQPNHALTRLRLSLSAG